MRPVAVALRRPRLNLGVGPQVVVVALVVALTGAMAIQPTRQLVEQRDRIEQMARDLRRLRHSNTALAASADRLRDPDYLEQQARAQLGLVRPGETTYVVMPPRRGHGGSDRGNPPRRAGAAAPRPGYLERLFEFIGWR